ncbi:DUF4446 family protein [candidate division WS5 bacterium]|uniref:DUF4446 family protein n=1 Tax=candidate division WS5 bacterium TaxID=2093353 RepID=A0A419DAT5_9BACT|nr:MAG: DUF4446 family protein [candidate division WS5 bacterium]
MNMDTNIILIAFASVTLIFFLWMVFLSWRQNKMYKRVGEVFNTSKNGDIYQIMKKYLEETKEVEKYAKKVEAEMVRISRKMENSIQKVGFIRYNPFGKDDTGGNQSFSVALLDKNDSGVVISSMHAREGTRVYAKNIMKGKSIHSLSDEEKEAIQKASGKS